MVSIIFVYLVFMKIGVFNHAMWAGRKVVLTVFLSAEWSPIGAGGKRKSVCLYTLLSKYLPIS